MTIKNYQYDFLIIGSGMAGLSLALKVAELGKVCIVTKDQISSTNSAMAQGGIAAVMSDEDDFEKHVEDTLIAGAGLCHKDVVQKVVSQGPERIKDLVDWGLRFDISDKNGQQFSLTKEGGHSQRRILHIGDHTGRDMHQAILSRVIENKNIEIMDSHLAIDLVTSRQVAPYSFNPYKVVGAYLLQKNTGNICAVKAKSTILASGGAGKVYLYTSNWEGATGDGIAMAFRAGARIANLEFMQFHPTCLYHPHTRNFLITEAIRGEGGELINHKGEAFMKKYHKLGSLAPRDIVARSIDAEMKKHGIDCVYLDISNKDPKFLKSRFPNIYNKCLEFNIDITAQPIPVVPAAHYMCGGVMTDINGRTDVDGLFAVGETACTGLHGANRLASNSLLECLVFSHNASEWIKKHYHEMDFIEGSIPEWHLHKKNNADELIVVSHMWDEIRRLMWNYVGIVRSNRRLERAQHRIDIIKKEIVDYYSNFKTHADIVELRNIALIADLTIKCALKRKESRGIHYNIDFPTDKDSVANDSIITLESSMR